MNNSTLNTLLKEYENIQMKSIRDAENRKKELYLSNPDLQKIDDKISKLSIDSAKLILQNNSKNALSNLKKEIGNLKKEKEAIFKSLKLPLNYLEPIYKCNICKDTGYIYENRKNYYV